MSLSSSAMPSSTTIKRRQSLVHPITLNDKVPMGGSGDKKQYVSIADLFQGGLITTYSSRI